MARATTGRRWRPAVLLAAVALSAGALIGYFATRDAGAPGAAGTGDVPAGPGPAFAPRPGSGARAPDFTLPAFPGPGTVSLSDFRGTPLVLNFWASWCPFCIEEMPAFERVHARLRPHVAFLGVNLQDDPALAERLLERTGVTYPIGADPDGSLFAELGGLGMPTTVLITADGRIADMIAGPLTGEALEDRILEHLVVPA